MSAEDFHKRRSLELPYAVNLPADGGIHPTGGRAIGTGNGGVHLLVEAAAQLLVLRDDVNALAQEQKTLPPRAATQREQEQLRFPLRAGRNDGLHGARSFRWEHYIPARNNCQILGSRARLGSKLGSRQKEKPVDWLYRLISMVGVAGFEPTAS